MITKEELQQLMKQENAVETVYKVLSEQEKRILSLEEELDGIKSGLDEV